MSAKMRAEEYVRRVGPDARHPAFLDGVSDAVIITDNELDAPGPTILYVNRAFLQLTGYDAADLLGNNPRLMQGYDTDPAELARMKATLAAGQDFTGSVLNYRKDGSDYVVSWIILPVCGAGGDISRWLSIQFDVISEARALRGSAS